MVKLLPYISGHGREIQQEDLSAYLLPGDVGFSRGTAWYSRAIRSLTRSRNEPATYTNHTFGAVCNGVRIGEALATVKIHSVSEWPMPGEWEIWRHLSLSWDQRVGIAGYVEKREGRVYGGLKIVAHLGDALLTKIVGATDVRAFRRLCRMEQYPICSWLLGFGYEENGSRLSAVEARYAAPDDQHDWCKRMPFFVLVAKRYASGKIFVFNAQPRGREA